VLDIGKSADVSDYQRIAYAKHAMVSWESGRLALNGGLISTTQYCKSDTTKVGKTPPEWMVVPMA
jgi:hypothetical protein